MELATSLSCFRGGVPAKMRLVVRLRESSGVQVDVESAKVLVSPLRFRSLRSMQDCDGSGNGGGYHKRSGEDADSFEPFAGFQSWAKRRQLVFIL